MRFLSSILQLFEKKKKKNNSNLHFFTLNKKKKKKNVYICSVISLLTPDNSYLHILYL